MYVAVGGGAVDDDDPRRDCSEGTLSLGGGAKVTVLLPAAVVGFPAGAGFTGAGVTMGDFAAGMGFLRECSRSLRRRALSACIC